MSVALDILILLTAIWLPHYQPWVIIEGTHPKHGTIIRTVRKHVRKSLVIYSLQKFAKAKIFLGYVKHFLILASVRKCRI